jgi:hypothetical protein
MNFGGELRESFNECGAFSFNRTVNVHKIVSFQFKKRRTSPRLEVTPRSSSGVRTQKRFLEEHQKPDSDVKPDAAEQDGQGSGLVHLADAFEPAPFPAHPVSTVFGPAQFAGLPLADGFLFPVSSTENIVKDLAV